MKLEKSKELTEELVLDVQELIERVDARPSTVVEASLLRKIIAASHVLKHGTDERLEELIFEVEQFTVDMCTANVDALEVRKIITATVKDFLQQPDLN